MYQFVALNTFTCPNLSSMPFSLGCLYNSEDNLFKLFNAAEQRMSL